MEKKNVKWRNNAEKTKLQMDIALRAAKRMDHINQGIISCDTALQHPKPIKDRFQEQIELHKDQSETPHSIVMSQRSTLAIQCQEDRKKHLLEKDTMAVLHQLHDAEEAARFENHTRTLQKRFQTKSSSMTFQEPFPNYEHDPTQALNLFWETSALLRFEHDLSSNELLNEIRESRISDSTKQSCLENFKREMDPDLLELNTCAVCFSSSFDDNEMVPLDKLSLLRLSQEKFLELTNSPLKTAATSFWNDTSLNLGYYIHPSLVCNHKAPVCRECLNSLTKKKSLPKYCLGNGYDLGNWTTLNLPPLTDAEKLSISLFRPFGKIIKLLPASGLGPDSQQTALKGHIIHFPLDGPNVLSHELPRRDIYASIQVMFIGTLEQYEVLKKHASFSSWHHQTFTIRGHVIMAWLKVLKEVNWLYANINIKEFSAQEIEQFHAISEDMIHSRIVATDHLTTEIETSTSSNIASFASTGDCGLHSVLLTEDHIPSNSDGSNLRAVHKMVQETNTSISIHQGSVLPNEFGENDNLILGTYPWLFLLGQGVPSRFTEPQDWFNYILSYGDNRFSTEQTFILSLFNQRQRHQAAITIAAKVKSHPKKIEEFISCVNDPDFMIKLETAMNQPTSKETKSFLNIILPTLSVTGATVPFGPLERNKSLSQLYAMCQHFGLPTWFLTISPSDIDSPLVMKLSGLSKQDIELVLATPEVRAKISAMNPLSGAKYFQRLVDKVFIHLFGATANGESEVRKTRSYLSKKVGILGKLIAHFVVFEVQGRGSLHLHSLIWTTLSPSLLQKVAHIPHLVTEVKDVLNSMVMADIPLQGFKDYHERKMRSDIYHGQLHICPQYVFKQEFRQRLEAVVTTVNIHHHRPTCRHGKSGKTGCRFAYPQAFVENGPRPVQLCLNESGHVVANDDIDPPNTINEDDEYYPIESRDPRTIVWELRRLKLREEKYDESFPLRDYEDSNKNVVPYNDILSAAIGCNTCLEPLGSTEQAKSAVYYQVKYITKKSTELTNTLSVLYESKKKVDQYPSKADDTGTAQRTAMYLLNKSINTMSTQNEVSAMMASASLMGMPAKMCSDIFWFCFIWPAIRYLKGKMINGSNYLHADDDDDDDDDIGIDASLEDLDHEEIFDANLLSRNRGEGSCQLFKVGDKFIAVQQHTHYQYRGMAFKDYNFLEYCAIINIKPKSTGKRKYENLSTNENMNEEDFLVNSELSHSGRKVNATFDFQEGHPLYTSHYQSIRSKFCIPILSGYPPPILPPKLLDHNRNWIDHANRFAEFYITLMVPWCIHHHVPLIQYNYEGLCEWMRSNICSTLRIDQFRNMSINIKATCLRLDSHKRSMMNYHRNEETTEWSKQLTQPASDKIDDEDGLNYCSKEGKLQPDIEIIVQVIRDESHSDDLCKESEGPKYIRDQLNTMEFFFPISVPRRNSFIQRMSHDPLLLISKKTLNEISKALSKDSDTTNRSISLPTPSSPTPRQDSINIQEGLMQTYFNTSYECKLNVEQNQCLSIVMEYLNAKENHDKFPDAFACPPPLKLIIHGGPGTGKTRLAEIIVSRIRQHGAKVACVAPTGVAASLLPGGRTLHNLFSLPITRKPGVSSDSNLDPLSADKLHMAAERFDNACLLIIDEMSMINTIMLNHVNTRLQQIIGNKNEFGGIPVILTGDMFQLPPTAGESLYKTVFTVLKTHSWQRPSQQGAELFTSFRYFELTTQMRSSHDSIHSDLINEMRNTRDFHSFSNKLLNHLRELSTDDIYEDNSWSNAPIIVTSNYERHSINFYKAQAFAASLGVPVLTWRKPIAGNLGTQFTDDALDLLYSTRVELIGIFVQSAPCVLREENINPTRGLANGTAASLHSICLDDPDGEYHDLIMNATPGQLISIPCPRSINVEVKYQKEDAADRIQNWPNELTLQPGSSMVSKAVVIPVLLNTDHNGLKFKNTTLLYKDHFVDLAFAMTYHKVQGKTLDKIILDINPRPGTNYRMGPLDFFGLYVGISRVRDSRNMRILPLHLGMNYQHIQKLHCDAKLRRWIEGYSRNPEHWEMISEENLQLKEGEEETKGDRRDKKK